MLGLCGLVACDGGDRLNRDATDETQATSDAADDVASDPDDTMSPLDGADASNGVSDTPSAGADDALAPTDTPSAGADDALAPTDTASPAGEDAIGLTDSLMPDTLMPDTLMPDTLAADTQTPDTQTPDTQTPDTSPSSCTLPWGATLAHGQSVTAFVSASAACGSACSPEARVCNNGVLSGQATNQTCFVDACQPCSLPWGGSVAHASSVTAYGSATVGCGAQCVSEARTCANGVLSGTYASQACSVTPCNPCALPWGGTIAHGGSATAYAATSPACGSACAAETRTCTDGVLSGDHTAQACTVASCAACALPWGGTLANGASVTAYASASPACGGTCAPETRTCTAGVLSGTYTAQACTVASCAPEIIMSTTFGGPAMTSIPSNKTMYGRVRNLTATNTQSCAEPLGNPVPNCRNGAPWTTLPNADWSYDVASSEWRAVFPANTFPPVTVEMFARNTQTGQQSSLILTLTNPCWWSAIVPGPVTPPSASTCTPATPGATTNFGGYTWTCMCN